MFAGRFITRSLKTSPSQISCLPAIQLVRPFFTSRTNNGALSDAVAHDHRELEEYYNNILGAADVDTKTRWQNQFTWELARHSIAEELVVYPVMERRMPNGKQAADKDRQQHLTMKEALYKFQGLKPNHPDFEPTLKNLMSDLSQHNQEEEKDELPVLEKQLQAGESENLATSFNRTKKFVPSRSHPSAPDKPPYETVAGLMAAPVDHLMDLFRKFPK